MEAGESQWESLPAALGGTPTLTAVPPSKAFTNRQLQRKFCCQEKKKKTALRADGKTCEPSEPRWTFCFFVIKQQHEAFPVYLLCGGKDFPFKTLPSMDLVKEKSIYPTHRLEPVPLLF